MLPRVLACFIAALGAVPAFPGIAPVEEKGLFVPMPDVTLGTPEGTLRLSQLFGRQPLLLTLVFTRCTGICDPFLLQLGEHLAASGRNGDFKVVVVSFDPRDNMSDMMRYARLFGKEADPDWLFATTPQIDELTAAAGMLVQWDTLRQQFDHDAILLAVNENGYVVRKMAGMRGRVDVGSLLRSLGGEYIPSYPLPGQDLRFSCFSYDPATGTRKPSAGLLMLVLPAAITMAMLVLLAVYGRILRPVHRTEQEGPGNAARASPISPAHL